MSFCGGDPKKHTLRKFYSLLLKMAIEIMSFPIKHGGSFHSYVSLSEGKDTIQHVPVPESQMLPPPAMPRPESLWPAAIDGQCRREWMETGQAQGPLGEQHMQLSWCK